MRQLSLTLAMATAGLLVACGGSPSDSPAPSGNGGTGNGATGITLTGVVAKGAALVGASVSAKCATGTVTAATTGADGSYTITITDGALPCLLEATGTGADATLVLHSVAAGTGSGSATSNITPLTELLVAQLTGQDPADYMASVSSGDIATTVTTGSVSSAQTAVLGTLTAAGVDTSAITNLVSGALVAANGGTTGNGYDLVLDNLAAALTTAGTTLAELTDTVATTAAAGQSGGTTETTPSDNALPADLLLRPKASNCNALRSTNYRIVKLTTSSVADDTSAFTAIEMVTIDAVNLTATFARDGEVMTLTPNGNCRYTLPEGDAMVSPAGVMVLRHMVGGDDDSVGAGDRGANRLMIGMPVQTLALADLAGNWNFIGVDREATAMPVSGSLTIGAAGEVTNDRCFENPLGTPDASCTLSTDPTPSISVHADGGFSLNSNPTDPDGPWVDRIFAYRAGNGEPMILAINNWGELVLGTKTRTLPLPAVGDVTTNITLLADPQMVANDAVQSHTNTISSVDANTGIVVRSSSITGSGVTHPQTLRYNQARNGYLQRDAAVAAGSDSNNWIVRHFEGLPLIGMGITVLYLPNSAMAPANNARFALSVRQ